MEENQKQTQEMILLENILVKMENIEKKQRSRFVPSEDFIEKLTHVFNTYNAKFKKVYEDDIAFRSENQIELFELFIQEQTSIRKRVDEIYLILTKK